MNNIDNNNNNNNNNMNMNNSEPIRGVFYCNQYRTEELNKRIFERNIPSRQFQHQFSNRPVSTKFEQFQTISKNIGISNGINNTEEKILNEPLYNIKSDFNPGTSAPPQGYLNNIDDESRLKRQFFPNQNNYQSKWIPSTNSSLYNADKFNLNENQPYPRLFLDYNNFNNNNNNNTLNKNEENIVCQYKTSNKLEKYNVGKDLWQNSTRQQLKNIKY